MLRTLWNKCLAYGAAGITALALGQLLSGQQIAPLPPIPGLPEPVRDVLILTNDDSAAEQSDTDEETAKEDAKDVYWIGIGLGGELPEVAKQQLGLDHGLIVADVLTDSPAAKAEVKKFDILVKADDTPLKEPADLIKSVEGSRGKAIKIIIFRQGKEAALQITPAKRPESEGQHYRLRVPNKFGPEIKGLEEALEKLKGKAGNESLGLFFARPGMVTPRVDVLFKPAQMPKNLSVQILKEGDKPAKIHVKRDDQEWEVTEDKLSDLPEDVRKHVLGFLRRPEKLDLQMNLDMKGPAAAALRSGRSSASEGDRGPGPTTNSNRSFNYRVETGGLDSKLDSIMKKLDQLTKEVDDLRSSSKK